MSTLRKVTLCMSRGSTVGCKLKEIKFKLHFSCFCFLHHLGTPVGGGVLGEGEHIEPKPEKRHLSFPSAIEVIVDSHA